MYGAMVSGETQGTLHNAHLQKMRRRANDRKNKRDWRMSIKLLGK